MPTDDRQYAVAPRYASLRDYLRVVRERWLLIAAFTLVCGAAAFGYSATQVEVYETSAKLIARERSADIDLLGTGGVATASPQGLQAELAARAERDSVAKEVAKALDTGESPAQIAGAVSSSIDPQSSLVLITARDEDPQFAAKLANVYSREVELESIRAEREQIDEAIALVKRQLDESNPRTSPNEVTILKERLNRLQTLREIARPAEVITAATVPGSPVSPKPARNTLLGLLAGFFLGMIVAFIRDSLDTRLKTPREIEEHLGLTRVGQFTELALGRSIVQTNGTRRFDAIDLESARIMRTNVEALDHENAVRTLLVTSALPGEGKSTVAMALAWASAMAGKATLLVDCDLRRSVLADRLGLRPTPGLTDAIEGHAEPREVLQPIDLAVASGPNGDTPAAERPSLVCISAGSPVADPAAILGSNRFSTFLKEVRAVYDLVILDTSPLLSVVDTRELLRLVDGAVVCARSYRTTRDQTRAAREALEAVPPRLSGLVVTGVKLRDDEYSSYYRRYVDAAPGLRA
jgi:capsular exopolysaccharide synthesis family protein